MKVTNTEQFIIKSKSIYGDKKFGYDKVLFNGPRAPVELFCFSCNVYFIQKPESHYAGYGGCSECKEKKKTLALAQKRKQFIKKAVARHKQKFKYDEQSYAGNTKHMRIFCNTCQKWFTQTPVSHLQSCGCFTCAYKARSKTTEEFIKEAQIKHNNLYTYHKTVFTGWRGFIIVTCPVHGDFRQNAGSHLRGNGCLYCGQEKFMLMCNSSKTTEEYIKEAQGKHKNKYLYNKTVYMGAGESVIITCKHHGDFSQGAGNHLGGNGCPECAVERLKKAITKTTKQFLIDAKNIHGEKYIYPQDFEYKHSESLVSIICPTHGVFRQKPTKHLAGHGCHTCNGYQLGAINYTTIERCKEQYINRAGCCYILKCTDTNEEFYKIGITSDHIVRRFYGKLPYPYIVLYEHKTSVYNAFYIEQYLHEILKDKKYTPKIKFGGYTECLSEIPSIKELEKHIKDVEISIENNTHRDHLQ